MTEPQLTRKPVPNVDTELDALVNEYLDMLADRAKLDTRIADLDVLLVSRLGTRGNRHELAGMPGVGVRVQQPSQRFNAARAEEVLTEAQLALTMKPKPDSATAKANLPGILLDLCRVPTGKPSVRAL